MVKIYNIITSLLPALLLFVAVAGTADADFSFRGYTYNETNVALNNTNVSIEIYQMAGGPPTLIGTNYTSSNETGYFNLSINGSLDNQSYMYKPVLKHFANNATSGTLDWIGQALPQFPQQMIKYLTVSSPMNFYLRKGGTINIRALNETNSPVEFKYMIKDTRLGYPITENFNVEQQNVDNIYVPLERNYSIMIFPNRSLPISYDLNNLSTYTSTGYNATITFNTSIRPRWVTGYANLSNGVSNFTNLSIIAYLMEPGDIIGKDRPMPSNMSAFRNNPGASLYFSDTYYTTNGSYNITLPGSAQGDGANILLFATAYSSSGDGEYYGAFKNITMNYSASDVPNFNFTLYPLLGRTENISVNNMGIQGPNTQNITTKMLPFQLINGSDNTNISNKFAHIEIQVNYSANGSSAFKWMVDVSQTSNGSFSIPAFNANIQKINVFMQDFAPIKTSKNTTQLAQPIVNITMTSFDNKKPDNTEFSGNTFIDMLQSKTECDRPVPASGCSLMPDPTTGQNESEFNPFKTVLGGGKISLRIVQVKATGNITVHYKNVDMLASGPPDALFDESASSSQSGSSIEEAWRFGSKGPEIYDEVLIGVPVTTTGFSGIKIGKLYDENWNSVWNITDTNAANTVPSDYSEFPSSWFSSTGPTCSTTDNSSACYIDSTNGILWLRIPHFSGVGPTVLRTTSSGSSSGGGGSTGGGGVTTSEPFANIATAERYDKSLIANTPVTYTFKAPGLGIYEIAVTGKENENDIAIRVEALKGTANGVAAAAPGVVYRNLNIIAGTTRIKEAIIKFKVETSWLTSNNLAGNEVVLMRWDGSKWNPLETSEKDKDNTYTIFEAKTPGFSSFAITGLKATATPTATPAAGITGTPAGQGETAVSTPTALPAKKGMPGFEAIMAVLVISLLAASLINDRKRR